MFGHQKQVSLLLGVRGPPYQCQQDANNKTSAIFYLPLFV